MKDKKKRWEPVFIGIAIMVGLAPLLAIYTFLMMNMFTVGVQIGQPGIVLTTAFVFAQMLILIFGIFYLMGSFYFSRDLNILIPLPLKPYEVLGSKFTVVMVNELLTALPLLIPPFIIYGVGTGQGLFYWIKAIVLLAASPVIPLALSALFVVLLMRVVNVGRHKDLLVIIGSFLGIILALSFNFLVRNIPKNGEAEYFKNLLMSHSGLINEIGRKFPPSIWATFGLSDNGASGWGYFFLFVIVSVALFLLLLWLANRVFYKGLLAGQEVIRKRKAMTVEESNRIFGRINSPIIAIYWREWKLLLRTPVYVINGLTGAILGPLLLVIMLISGKGVNNPEFAAITKIIANPEYTVFIVLGVLGLALFSTGANLTASTAISREGQTFWISKIIPVTPKQQVLAKFYQALTISVLSMIVLTIVVAIFLNFTVINAMILLVLGILGSIPVTALLLMLDLFHPKLVWNSPQEAMKQNMNSGLGILIALLVIAILAVAVIVLMKVKAQVWLIYIALGFIFIIISIPAFKGLLALAEKKYLEIEM